MQAPKNRIGISFLSKNKERWNFINSTVPIWVRGPDLNQRPQGYEPCELPTALPRYISFQQCILYHLVWFLSIDFLRKIIFFFIFNISVENHSPICYNYIDYV